MGTKTEGHKRGGREVGNNKGVQQKIRAPREDPPRPGTVVLENGKGLKNPCRG
jgi:hypothetical protein